ncbi:MAG: hypothetical protein D6790_07980 [Caldilineae bacterium]|nr:MAG: hypothetical protein D6790_07980 [Caldilineae bacterium]
MFQHSAASAIPVDLPIPRERTSLLQGLGRLERRLPLPRTWREYLAWLMVMGLLTALAGLQVSTALRVQKTRIEIQALRMEYESIQRQNAQLLWEISQHTNLEQVAQRAEALGFRPTLQRKFLGAPGAPIQAQAPDPAPLPTTTDASPALVEPFVPPNSEPQGLIPPAVLQGAAEQARLVQGWATRQLSGLATHFGPLSAPVRELWQAWFGDKVTG